MNPADPSDVYPVIVDGPPPVVINPDARPPLSSTFKPPVSRELFDATERSLIASNAAADVLAETCGTMRLQLREKTALLADFAKVLEASRSEVADLSRLLVIRNHEKDEITQQFFACQRHVLELEHHLSPRPEPWNPPS